MMENGTSSEPHFELPEFYEKNNTFDSIEFEISIIQTELGLWHQNPKSEKMINSHQRNKE